MEKKTQDKNVELVKRAAELAKVEKDLEIAKALLTKVRTKADKTEAKEAIEEKAKEFRKAAAKKTPKKTVKKTAAKPESKTPKKTPKKAAPKVEPKTVVVPPKEEQGVVVLELMEKGLKGVEFEVIGSWVWATGDTKPVKDSLKAAGFHFSAKKSAWYWKPTVDMPKGRAKFNSMDKLRTHWAA